MSSFYDLQATSIDHKPELLSKYQGYITLVVNTASECGFTPQYKSLESLYQKYKDKDFTVLAFPSNDFGEQEPGTEADIKIFCESKYNVSFPLFSKVKVLGEEKSEVYEYLTSQSPSPGEVKWNFEKFLIDKEGNVVERFSSKTDPESDEIKSAIEKRL